MERLTHLHTVEYVDYIPQEAKMQVTPLGGGHGWQFTSNGTKVTLSPSILNGNCPNKAHYFIRDNAIVWA